MDPDQKAQNNLVSFLFCIRLRTTLDLRHLDMVISSKMVEKKILCLMAIWELMYDVEDF